MLIMALILGPATVRISSSIHRNYIRIRSFSIRIAVQRLRNLQEKKEAQAKVARRDIAMLLEQRKVEKARVKVETSEYVLVFLSLLGEISPGLFFVLCCLTPELSA